MRLTIHEKLIVKDLQQLYTTRRLKKVTRWLIRLAASLGLCLVLWLQPEHLNTILVGALCGGLLGAEIEKAYLTKVATITLKLYQSYLSGDSNRD